MGEQTNPGNEGVTKETETVAEVENVDVAALIADRDKWKHFSKQHENNWKTLSKEHDALKTATQTDTERALETARNEGRQAAVSEYAGRLTEAELSARAAKAGVTLPNASFINMAALMNDGEPNGDAIDAFIADLPKAGPPSFDQDVIRTGAGGDSGKPRQLTRSDLHGMSNEEINDARLAGQLNDLLGIK